MKLKYEKLLVEGGLLNPSTGSKLVKGIAGEDELLAKWQALVPGIGMRIERLVFEETRCYPLYPE